MTSNGDLCALDEQRRRCCPPTTTTTTTTFSSLLLLFWLLQRRPPPPPPRHSGWFHILGAASQTKRPTTKQRGTRQTDKRTDMNTGSKRGARLVNPPVTLVAGGAPAKAAAGPRVPVNLPLVVAVINHKLHSHRKQTNFRACSWSEIKPGSSSNRCDSSRANLPATKSRMDKV